MLSLGALRAEQTTQALDVSVAGGGDEPVATRTLPIRAWMLIAPVDFVAAALPGLIAPEHLRAFIAMGVLCVVLLHSNGRYRARLHLSTLDEIPNIAAKAFLAGAIVASLTALRHPSAAVADFLRWAILSAVLLGAGRLLSTSIIRTARKRRVVGHSTVLVGAGPVGIELLRLLDAYPQYGLRVTALVDDPHQADEPRVVGGHMVRPLSDLDSEVLRVRADVILVADPSRPDGQLLTLVRRPAASRCDLMVVPRLHDFHTQVGLVDHIGAIPIMRIKSPALLGPARFVKRAFDIVVASLVFLLVSPVMIAAALAVRLEGGKGILFRQARLTRDGRVFQVLKFRSMRPVDENEANSQWTIANDSRVGPVGRVLRQTSIDELPQLWNILRGDMTLVGPRPERPFFVEQFTADNPRYADRHRVVCGLTGLAQVSGLRGDTSITDRARYDNFYIENWSLWMDVKVLLRTIGEVFGARGR